MRRFIERVIMASFAVCIVGVAFFLIGSSEKVSSQEPCVWHEGRVDNIERVFMHRPWSYSFLVQGEGSTYTLVEKYADTTKSLTFVADVGKDQPMWAKFPYYKGKCSSEERGPREAQIHIRALNNVEGGGWSAGKGGQGTTIPIQ